jgi:hypothetical protein
MEITGSFCGYVGVEPSHPAHGLNYDGAPYEEAKAYHKALRESLRGSLLKLESPKPIPGVGDALDSIGVHGGLTFSGLRDEFDHGRWYFGFDCGHHGDFMPAVESRLKQLYVDESMVWKKRVELFDKYDRCVYRDMNYVKDQCHKLALQLKAIDNIKVPTFMDSKEESR